MENIESTNTNEGSVSNVLIDLKEAQTAQIMGVISVFVLFSACCYLFAIFSGLLSLILGIIAFRKGKDAIAEYEVNPGMYTKKSFNRAKTGKTTGLIGLIVGGLMVLSILGVFGVAFFID